MARLSLDEIHSEVDSLVAHSHLPVHLTVPQQAALVGTVGTPGATNRFVTDEDTRLAGVHDHTGVYAPVHDHPYAGTVHAHDYAATIHTHNYAEPHDHPYEPSGTVAVHAGLANVAHGAAAVRRGRAAAQSIPNDTETIVDTLTTVHDDANFASITDGIKIPTGYGGRYDVGLAARFATNATGRRRFTLLQNATVPHWVEHSASPTVNTTGSFTLDMTLADGDELKLRVWQNSGGALNLSGTAATLRLWAIRRGPA